MAENIELEQLADAGISFANQLLSDEGEFYPFAMALDNNAKVTSIGNWDGDDFPKSENVIQNLKKGFQIHQTKYIAVAIFYDVKVTNPDTDEKTDAVAVFFESKKYNKTCVRYFPYKLNNGSNPDFFPSFTETAKQEIFI